MSAEIPSTMPLSDLLKSTGYNCPESMQGKTFDEATSGGADLEDNKEATIDVSAYTDPVEITPTQGKDGMKKTTVSLSNIPAGATMLYAWDTTDTEQNPYIVYLNINSAPTDIVVGDIKYIEQDTNRPNDMVIENLTLESDTYVKVSDTEFTLSYENEGQTITFTYTRNSTKDVEVWNAPPEVETTKQATIDVSTYDPSNKPVITPTVGKQSMAEVEVTLTNIPQPSGSVTAYAWSCADSRYPQDTPYNYFNASSAPADATNLLALFGNVESGLGIESGVYEGDTYTKISDTSFSISWEEGQDTVTQTYTRDPTKDFTLWQISQ